MNDFVLYGLNSIYILVIRGRFSINIEDVEGFLGQSVFNINDISHYMSQGTKFLLDVVEVGGVMEVSEHHPKGSFFLQLVSVIIYVPLLAVRDCFSVGITS